MHLTSPFPFFDHPDKIMSGEVYKLKLGQGMNCAVSVP
jgi:hypothetical protein